MKKFLEYVADDLYRKYGNNISDITVVFPNHRAELFFNNYLYAAAGKTIWSPQYTTISDLVANSTTLAKADSLLLICELYNVYKTKMKTDETFSDFYFWGDLLLHDFDDVDKNLADAKQLFSNLQELKKLKNTFDFLSEEQRDAIEQFFANFSFDKQSTVKQRFIEIWDVLGDIYFEFKQRLMSKNIAYEGMMYRAAIDDLEQNLNEKFPEQRYIFVGFNVLNACEKKLFTTLKNAGKALFYWDYDNYYLNNSKQEAGRFMRENLQNYPSELSDDIFDVFCSNNKKVNIISASTENAQARYIPCWISNLQDAGSRVNSNSAVVLCNESLLLPTLHVLPQSIDCVNITMGFPLSQTPIYSAINTLLDLQTIGCDSDKKIFYRNYVYDVLQNQYLQTISGDLQSLKNELDNNGMQLLSANALCKTEILQKIFLFSATSADIAAYLLTLINMIIEKKSDNNQLYDEAIFRTYTYINRLHDLIESNNLELNVTIFATLLRRVLFSASVPFHGEPLKGLQIMGVLETRNLDFENVILLSATDDLLPKSGGQASFIPYNMRRAFGLSTIENSDAVYAYYFYRVLQRAQNVTIMYSTSANGTSHGEPSRFVLQLMLESNLNIGLYDIQSQIQLPKIAAVEVAKNDEIIKKIKGKCSGNGYLSPSALNTLIDCSLKFYFKYIANLSQPNAGNAISADLGNVFHKSAETIYKKINKFNTLCINGSDIEIFETNKNILPEIVDAAMADEMHISQAKYSGEQLIVRKVVLSYLKKLLKFDKDNAPFTMLSAEQLCKQKIEINIGGQTIDVNIGGRIDRLDLKNGVLRVVDYKTGGGNTNKQTIDKLFVSSNTRDGYIFQVLLYSLLMHAQKNGEYTIKPAILYVNKTIDENSADIAVDGAIVEDITQVKQAFENNLKAVVADLFDASKPFVQTENTKACEYCDFAEICKNKN